MNHTWVNSWKVNGGWLTCSKCGIVCSDSSRNTVCGPSTSIDPRLEWVNAFAHIAFSDAERALYHMTLGPGKYDYQLSQALKDVDARQGILVVLDGARGPSFCMQLEPANAILVPVMLRDIADKLDADMYRAGIKRSD